MMGSGHEGDDIPGDADEPAAESADGADSDTVTDEALAALLDELSLSLVWIPIKSPKKPLLGSLLNATTIWTSCSAPRPSS
jgi:hypothetical protein